MPEVRVEHSVGKALSANTDALKHTIASQLMHNQRSFNDSYKEKCLVCTIIFSSITTLSPQKDKRL